MLKSKHLENEQSTLNLGKHLASFLKPGHIVFLNGNLGAGKTTLMRGILRGFNFLDPVKSPTYTLVEEYEFDWGKVHHFDLYRVNDPKELMSIGIQDYFEANAINVVEWAERGGSYLPRCDLELDFSMADPGRTVAFTPSTVEGERLLKAIFSDPKQPIQHSDD